MGGGTSLSDKEKIKNLENRISLLEQRLATEEAAGLVMLSDSEAVTESTGLALPASEKNAAISGTLGNKISVLRRETANAYNSSVFKKDKTEASSDKGRENGYAWINNADVICFKAGNSSINIGKVSGNDSIVVRACGIDGVFSDWKRIN